MRQIEVKNGDITLNVRLEGDPDAPLILFLHGFPEYGGAWEEMFARFSGDHFCVAPDQRGYGRSSAPPEVVAYRGGNMVGDALAVLDALRPGGAARAVVAHDWGAAIGYGLAFRAPERLERLVIVNGVHPIPFQRALATGGAQTAASQYIPRLRAEGSEDVLAANDFERLRSLFAGPMSMDWLAGERLAAYKAAWSGPGVVRGMVNWYRATPLKVGRPGEPFELPEMPVDAMRVPMPHLLIWGMRDRALLPEARAGLEAFCDDLTVHEIADADHWVIHQKPDEVAATIRAFLA